MSSYREHIREYAHMGYLATWYATIKESDLFAIVAPKLRTRLQKMLNKAKKGSHLQVLEKMTDLIDNKQRIVESAPLSMSAVACRYSEPEQS